MSHVRPDPDPVTVLTGAAALWTLSRSHLAVFTPAAANAKLARSPGVKGQPHRLWPPQSFLSMSVVRFFWAWRRRSGPCRSRHPARVGPGPTFASTFSSFSEAERISGAEVLIGSAPQKSGDCERLWQPVNGRFFPGLQNLS